MNKDKIETLVNDILGASFVIFTLEGSKGQFSREEILEKIKGFNKKASETRQSLYE